MLVRPRLLLTCAGDSRPFKFLGPRSLNFISAFCTVQLIRRLRSASEGALLNGLARGEKPLEQNVRNLSE